MHSEATVSINKLNEKKKNQEQIHPCQILQGSKAICEWFISMKTEYGPTMKQVKQVS